MSVLILFLVGMKSNQRTATVETADKFFSLASDYPEGEGLLRLRKIVNSSGQKIQGAAVLWLRELVPELFNLNEKSMFITGYNNKSKYNLLPDYGRRLSTDPFVHKSNLFSSLEKPENRKVYLPLSLVTVRRRGRSD